jgi:hypothetical protein
MRGRQNKVNMPSLEQQFTQAMFGIYRGAKTEAGYNATIFLQMISERGGVRTAKALINATRSSDGNTHLYERGHLEITVEAVVVENPKWHGLFTPEEIARARKRLKDYRYEPKG